MVDFKKIFEEIRKKESGIIDSFPVHPIQYRNILITQGFTKQEANSIVIKQAKKQGYSGEPLEALKEALVY